MASNRTTIRADQMGATPCIRALRIPVSVVVQMVAEGMGSQEILSLYPEAEDVIQALQYAAEAARKRQLGLASNG